MAGAAAPATSVSTIKFKCVRTVKLFERPQRNRKMNKYELAHDLDAAKAFKRLPCTYLLEKPYYPWLYEKHDNYNVNFDLNYQ